jgi:hypothetical protein
MSTERKQINFTIVPDDTQELPRTYANFCAISHTPFDFTLAFCEVLPLSEKDIKAAEADHVVRAPVRAKVVVPLQVVPNLIAALQEHMKIFSESTGTSWEKGPGHETHPRGFAPRTPLHAHSLAASPARSVRVAHSLALIRVVICEMPSNPPTLSNAEASSRA